MFGLLVGPTRHRPAARAAGVGVHGRVGRHGVVGGGGRAAAGAPLRHRGRRHDGRRVGGPVLRGARRRSRCGGASPSSSPDLACRPDLARCVQPLSSLWPGSSIDQGDDMTEIGGARSSRASKAWRTRSAPTSRSTARWARPAAVYVGGRKVVDLWGGVADRDAGTPYTEDSLQLVFSTTKGATAACANLLAQRGDLDIDAPVAEYWPEFKANGKGDIPVRWLLCHKAGLPVRRRHAHPRGGAGLGPDDPAPSRSRRRSGSPAPPTATTPPPTAGWWARWSGGSPARASARSSTTRSPRPSTSSSGSASPTSSRRGVAPAAPVGRRRAHRRRPTRPWPS